MFLDQFVANAHKRLLAMSEFEDTPYAYLQSRGVTDADIERFQVGYFVGDMDVRDETADFERFNRQSRYGKMLQKRLIFPLTNARGLLRGFESRVFEGEKSYFKFTLERHLADAWFFGLRQAIPAIWETKTIFLAEGIFDLFPLARIWPNSICAATVNVNPKQVEFLERFASTIYVVLDEDKHGERQFRRLQTELPKHDVIRLHIPSKDLSELWEKYGETRFREILMKEFTHNRV